MEPEPEPPQGWGVKFSAKRSLWYFFNLDDPKTTKWAPKRVAPACPEHDDQALSDQLERVHLATGPENSPSGVHRTRRILLVRHAYRLDEEDTRWPNKSSRPQDSPLAPRGLQQAAALGQYIAGWQETSSEPIVRVLASPFARTVQTAAAVVSNLGLDGSEALCVEQGLCEGAQMMARNHLCTEPFFLPPADLCVAAAACGGLDLRYKSQVDVLLRRGSEYPGRPTECATVNSQNLTERESTESISEAKQGKAVFNSRCRRLARALSSNEAYVGKTIVLVGHVASLTSLLHAFTGSKTRFDIRHTALTELRLDEPGRDWTVVGEACSLRHLPAELQT